MILIKNSKFKIQNLFFGLFLLVVNLTLLVLILKPTQTFALDPICNGATYPRVIQGLITAAGFGTGNNSKFGTSALSCIIGLKETFFLEHKVPKYQDWLISYFRKSTFTSKVEYAVDITHTTGSTQLNFDNAYGKIYHIKGNLTLTTVDPNPDISFPGGGNTGLIFVDGNLNINKNLPYGGTYSGLIFIVSGDINIDENVDRVDAVLVSFGTICTSYNGSTQRCEKNPAVKKQLIINGSLISMNTNKPIKFLRNLTDNSTLPAEDIIYQPKFLAILRGMSFANGRSVTGSSLMTEDITITYSDAEFENLASNFLDALPPAPSSPPAQPDILSVTCGITGSAPYYTNPGVTWNATIAGGQAPYTYTWTGDASGTGNTSSLNVPPIQVPYPTNGIRSVNIQITDNIGSPMATCSTPATASVFYPYNRIFITSRAYTGDLELEGGGIGTNPGIDGADKICDSTASKFSLGGTWKAWVSSAVSNASPRLTPANTALPYKLLNGTQVFSNWPDATDGVGTLPSFINVYEGNRTIPSLGAANTLKVWTNTSPSGTSATTNHCTDWTLASGTGRHGKTDATGAPSGDGWTNTGNDSCSTAHQIYCFETNQSPTATPNPSNLTFTADPAWVSNSGSTRNLTMKTSEDPTDLKIYWYYDNAAGLNTVAKGDPVPTTPNFTINTSITTTGNCTNFYFYVEVKDAFNNVVRSRVNHFADVSGCG